MTFDNFPLAVPCFWTRTSWYSISNPIRCWARLQPTHDKDREPGTARFHLAISSRRSPIAS